MKNVEEKRILGGVGFLLDGNILGAWKDSLIVRLGPDQGEVAPRASASSTSQGGAMKG
jgi:hypothetical protein